MRRTPFSVESGFPQGVFPPAVYTGEGVAAYSIVCRSYRLEDVAHIARHGVVQVLLKPVTRVMTYDPRCQ